MPNPIPLLPVPRQWELSAGAYLFESGRRIILDGAPPGALLFSAQRLQSALQRVLDVSWSLAAGEAGPASEIGAVLWLNPAQVAQPQGYELSITPNTISIVA